MLLSQGTHKGTELGDLGKKQVVFEGQGGWLFNFIEHLANKTYSCEFLSFVAHRMASLHPENKPKRGEDIGYVRELKVIFKVIRKRRNFPLYHLWHHCLRGD